MTHNILDIDAKTELCNFKVQLYNYTNLVLVYLRHDD